VTHGGPDGEKFAAQSEGGFSPLTGIREIPAKTFAGLAVKAHAYISIRNAIFPQRAKTGLRMS
jgi:hypothetical protein